MRSPRNYSGDRNTNVNQPLERQQGEERDDVNPPPATSREERNKPHR